MFIGMSPATLARTDSIRAARGRPTHTIIEGENLHVLGHLTDQVAGQVDMIYIDPPFNVGTRFWAYANDFGGHEAWTTFMRERLLAARPLLAPDSVLVCAVDAVEVHRLGLLLEEVFPAARIQMVTTVIAPSGQHRGAGFRRVEEYLFFVMLGDAAPQPISKDLTGGSTPRNAPPVRWESLIRSGTNATRADRPTMYYPIHVDDALQIVAIDDPVTEPGEVIAVPGTTAVLPTRTDGNPGRWQVSCYAARQALQAGTIKATQRGGRVAIRYLRAGALEQLDRGELVATGRDDNGVLLIERGKDRGRAPRTVWDHVSHSGAEHGTRLVKALVPGRDFTFPKSLYAVQDTLTLFLADKPDALVLDFFGGSGTTAHAVMRLNQADQGRRRCVLVTNNEVGRRDAERLAGDGYSPGEPQWEERGICRWVTIPRLAAAITGTRHDGTPVPGSYRWGVQSPIADGLAENLEVLRLEQGSGTQEDCAAA